MAAALTGVQASQPALVTRPAVLYRSVSPAGPVQAHRVGERAAEPSG